MDELSRIPLNTPGVLGVDRRAEETDVSALACSELLNYEVRPGAEGLGRVLPRSLLRRYGTVLHPLTLALQSGGANLSVGTYAYAYVYNNGQNERSGDRYIYVPATSWQVRVSGWPTAAGTVSIYRTVVNDYYGTKKLVVSGLDVTLNAFYDDNIADGALGANMPTVTSTFTPLGNTSFNQTALTDFLLVYQDAGESTRVLLAATRTNTSGTANLYVNFPELNETFNSGNGTATFPTAHPVDYAVLGGLLWIAAEGTALLYRDVNATAGWLATASQPGAPTIAFAAPGAGALSAATGHQYVVQGEKMATGIRSLPSNVINTGAYAGPQSNNINITAAGSGNDRWHLYRTTDGGAIFQLVASYTTAAGAKNDNTADSGLSLERLSYAVGAAGGFRYVEAWKGLLWVFNQVSTPPSNSLLRWSSELPYNFPADPLLGADYEMQIDEEDGDEGAGLIGWGDLLLVFKRRRAFAVSGDPPSNFRYEPIHGSEGLGCAGFRTLTRTAAGLFYLSSAGICWMPQPGARPVLISEPIRELFAEPRRAAQNPAPAIPIEYTNQTAATQSGLHFRVQLDTDPAFGSPDFDWETGDATERFYFTVSGVTPPAAGSSIASGKRVRVTVTPPSGSVVAETTYYVRYSINGGSSWTTLSATFRKSAAVIETGQLYTSGLEWAFALDYPQRQELWLFLPLGSRKWCERVVILNYSQLALGGQPLFRFAQIAASAGCTIDHLTVYEDNDRSAVVTESVDYLLIASPDGVLWRYPSSDATWDGDNRNTVANADRVVSATLSGTTLTASGTSWPTSNQGLKGGVLAIRDADGRTFTGLITANTGTTATVVWLDGRTPANGTVELVIGGRECVLETGWLALAEPPRAGLLREIELRCTPKHRGTLYLEVRAGREGDLPASQVLRPKISRTIPVGEGFENTIVDVALAGQRHKLKWNLIDPRTELEVRELILGVQPGGLRE